MKKIIKFRVYPESIHGFYFEVGIYPNIERMRAAAKRNGGKTSNFENAGAVTCGFRVGHIDAGESKIRWTKQLGLIAFNRCEIDAEIVAHESTHAAIRWMEEKRVPFDIGKSALVEDKGGMAHDTEERFCYAVGKITNQIVDEWIARDK